MNVSETEISEREAEIRATRLTTLIASWKMLCERNKDLREGAYLDEGLAAQVVERYLQDRQALVHRHNITGRIQRHKIAGLMTASIVKVRPVQLREREGPAARVSKDNEFLAAAHGLAVCGEGNEDGLAKLLRLPLYGNWLTNFVYFLYRRHDCAEACSFIFESLSITYFPSNLTNSAEEK